MEILDQTPIIAMLVLYLNANTMAAIILCGLTIAVSALYRSSKGNVLACVVSCPLSIMNALRDRWRAWIYLLNGPSMIQEGYNRAKGQPYEIFSPDNRYVFVSQEKHINEVDSAPDSVLSLQAASKQMLQPKYTMTGFSWFDRRGTEGVGFVRALRTLLTENIPKILPELRIAVSTAIDDMHDSHPILDGAKHSPLNAMVIRIVALTNARAFFGKELCQNEIFMRSALDFIEQTLALAEVIRLLPSFIAPTVGRALAKKMSSQEEIFKTMVPIAADRIRERDLKQLGHPVPVHRDCIQWIMETAPRQAPWSAERIVHELMAVWFGSVHVVSTTISFAIHDLCIHPEYVEPLRKELDSPLYLEFERTGKGLPLLDSFLKESARMTPVESMSTRRQAIHPFTFSDGTKLEVGDWTCTPLRAMLHDEKHFQKPSQFLGFRFVDKQVLASLSNSEFGSLESQKPSQLTDVDKHWHVWGTGRMACPGRYYAAAAMKMIVGQFLLKYDCELADKSAPRWFSWRSFIYPLSKTRVIFRPVVAHSK